MNSPHAPLFRWFPAILLQNFVAFPLDQEHLEESCLLLPIRVGRKESVGTVEEVQSDQSIPIVLVTVLGDPNVAPDAHLTSVGILATVSTVVNIPVAGPPCYDIAVKGLGRVVVDTIKLHSKGIFVARIAEQPVTKPMLSEISSDTVEKFRSEVAKLLTRKRDEGLSYYTEEQFGERLYPAAPLELRSVCTLESVISVLKKFQTVSGLTDIAAQYLSISPAEKQALLDEADAIKRFQRVLEIFESDGVAKKYSE